MNYLILGNGFDIEHGLPTRYPDFIKTCEYVKKYPVGWGPEGANVQLSAKGYDFTETGILTEFCNAIKSEKYIKFRTIVFDCFWIDHFISLREKIGEKWIDFENEIENIIEGLIKAFSEKSLTDIVKETPYETLTHCLNDKYYIGGKTIKDLFVFLQEQYKLLVESIEIYMGIYVNSITSEKKSDLFELKYDGVISFNYTTSFQRLYGDEIPCCFIHGKASSDRIVLGYQKQDNYDDRITRENIFYQKYYQRVINGTDNSYINWIEDIETSYDIENRVVIFGHSLSPVDGQILKDFITAKFTVTDIYYLDEADRADKIRNLLIILGQEEFQKRAGGKTPSITFKTLN